MSAILNEFKIHGENINQHVFVKENLSGHLVSTENLVRFIQYKMKQETQNADITFIGTHQYSPELEFTHIIL